MNSTKNGLLLSIIEATLESGPPAASVHNRSNISYTQVNTRTHTQSEILSAHRLAPLATPHTICIETHRSLHGITLFLGLNDPPAPRVRVPHAPAVYSIGIHRASYSAAADGRRIRQ
jgi:hypothetical protein